MCNKKNRMLISLSLFLVVLFAQGCSLATEGSAKDETHDELIGAWVVLQKKDSNMDEQLDLEDFKKEDAHVLYYSSVIEDDRQTIDVTKTGHVYGGSTRVRLGVSQGIDVYGEAYFTSVSPDNVKLIPIYEKPNGERYAMDEMSIWMGLDLESDFISENKVESSDSDGSLGSVLLTNSRQQTINQNSEEKEINIEINFIKKGDLEEIKLIHFDENFKMMDEENLDLEKIVDQEEPSEFKVKEGAEMIMVEETYTDPKENKPYVLRTIYSSQNDKDIIHEFVLPVKNDLGRKGALKFLFD